jgi:hypothetical protein
MEDSITAIVSADMFGRFLVRMREPAGAHRNPIEFQRGTLKEALRAADKLVQAYYPHECDETKCGNWHQIHD